MRLSLYIVLFLTGTCLNGQQSFQYSQFMLDKYQFNPAYGGLEMSLHVNAAVRTQWNGLPDAPGSQYINAHMPFYIWNGAVGFQISNENSGLIHNLSISGSYNYVMTTDYGLISGGLSLGIMQKSVNGRRITTPDGEYIDGNIDHKDPVLLDQDFTGIAPVWTLGGYYLGDFIEAGISISHFPEPPLKAGLSTFSLSTVTTIYGEYKYAYNDQLDIIPSLLIRTDFVEMQTDLAVMARINNNVFGSLGLRGYSARSLDGLVFLIGTSINNNYSIAYSFDTGLSALRTTNEGSHEIRLMYNLNRAVRTGMPPKIIYNPRRL
ncbi:MAG TPA: PorP/SprF family type IX secretion system membrane protein [Saprospiraceae bacterium]|nr:PorP/SprF family type IX secretion system membrane protein [Saprospiraceae bacterium]